MFAKKLSSLLLLFGMQLACIPFLHADLRVTDLRCDYQINPIGIDTAQPRLSWRLEASKQNVQQASYQILVASTKEKLSKDIGDAWDSGLVSADQSQHILYEGRSLTSTTPYYWKVKVTDNHGESSEWSETSTWSTGYLSDDDWEAKWIKHPDPVVDPDELSIIKATYANPRSDASIDVTEIVKALVLEQKPIRVHPRTLKQDGSTFRNHLDIDYILKGEKRQLITTRNLLVDFSGVTTDKKPSPHYRKVFNLVAAPESALLTVNTKAFVEVYVNGEKISDDVLTPAITARNKSFSVTYDIRPFLKKGENCVGLWVGHWSGPFSEGPMVRAQIDAKVNQADFTLVTDQTWETNYGGYFTTRGKYFGGEWIDARELIPEWSTPQSSSDGWMPAVETRGSPGVVSNQLCPLNRVGEQIPAVAVEELEPGRYEIDFGTNLTGWLRLNFPQLNEGDTITLTFSDLKTMEREQYSTQMGDVWHQTFGQVSHFISAGRSGEFFQHKFNYAAFRYVIVDGLPEAPKLSDAFAMLVESDLERVGSFDSSHDLFNRIFKLTEWTQRCLNLGGYTVDCPHRERKGYGDGQTHAEGFMTSFRADSYYRKWLMDWKKLQSGAGKMPNTAPPGYGGGGPAWGGFSGAITWRHYLYYGDLQVIEENYEAIGRYVEYLENIAQQNGGILTDVGDRGLQFIGDWVAPGRGMDTKNMPNLKARELFNNCWRIYHLQLYVNMAEVLGKTEEVKKYQAVIEAIRPLIHDQFYDPETESYVYDEQAYYILPLMTGVVPENLRGKVLNNLEKNIRETREGHLDTGMLGTYFMFEYLREIGRSDLLYLMTNKTTYPSWGYMLEQGATTVWEQWNGYWSQIHSCFPFASNWFYQGLGGIQADPSAPGFKNVIIKPSPVGDLKWVKTHHDSSYGRIVSNWTLDRGTLTMDVTLPANSSGTIYVPAQAAEDVLVNGELPSQESDVTFLRMEAERAVYRVSSGHHRFSSSTASEAMAKRN